MPNPKTGSDSLLMLYKVAAAVFVCSVFVNDNMLKLFGLTGGILFIPILLIGILKFTIIPNRMFFSTAGLMVGLIVIHVVFWDQGMTVAYRIIGSLALAIIVSGAFFNEYNPINYIKIYFLVSLIAVIAYYLGYWVLEENTTRLKFSSYNSNDLAIKLVFAYNSAVILRKWNAFKSPIRYICKYAEFIFLLPILVTYSKTAIFTFVFSILIWNVIVGKFFTIQRLGLITFVLLVVLILMNSIFFEFAERFYNPLESRIEEQDEYRQKSFDIALQLTLDSPVIGYGIDSVEDKEWLFSNGFNDRALGYARALSTHLGLMNLFLMGGLVLVILFILFWVSILRYFAKVILKPKNFPPRIKEFSWFIMVQILVYFIYNLGHADLYIKEVWLLLGVGANFIASYSYHRAQYVASQSI